MAAMSTQTNANSENVMNDEKRLVTQLLDVLDAYEGNKTLFACQGQSMDGYSALANFLDIVRKIRAVHSKEEQENM